MLNFSYITEAVKLKNKAEELKMVSFTPPKYHNCLGANVHLS